jgi:hypothetical protein
MGVASGGKMLYHVTVKTLAEFLIVLRRRRRDCVAAASSAASTAYLTVGTTNEYGNPGSSSYPRTTVCISNSNSNSNRLFFFLQSE